MANIFLVRHTKYVEDGVTPFRMPAVHLSEEGKAQAEEIGEYLKNQAIQYIYTSPMERTSETAEIISSHIDVKVENDFRLLEMASPFQGLAIEKQEEIVTNDNLFFNKRHLEYGGETYQENLTRMLDFFQEKVHDKNQNNIVIVSHGHPIMILYMAEKKLKMDTNVKIREQVEDYIPWAGIIKMEYNGKELLKSECLYQFANDK